MRKFLFFIVTIVAIADSEAANWVKLQENNHAKLLLDKQSITQKDALSRAWVKIEYKTPQKNTESADKTYNLSKLLWYFDCSTQKSAIAQVFQYLNAEAVFSAAVDIKAAEFIEPVPDTELDLAMRYVCASKPPVKTQTIVAAGNKTVEKPQSDKKVEAKPTDAEKGVVEAKSEVKPQNAPEAKPEARSEAVVAAVEKTEPAKTTKEKSPKEDKSTANWTYEGKLGPENWANLKPEFATCATGRNQSPINIDNTIDAPLKPLKGIQKVMAKEIVHSGHTVQANFKFGNMLLLDNVAYQMKSVQFRTPSENTIKGKSFPLEAHFVHADKNGNFAVLAVMFKEGNANLGLEKLLSQLPKAAATPIPLKAKVSASEIMPDNRDYYRFSGSLTTPPCTEGVSWIVFKTPKTASKEQIKAFEEAIKQRNNRPVQALNGRIVLE